MVLLCVSGVCVRARILFYTSEWRMAFSGEDVQIERTPERDQFAFAHPTLRIVCAPKRTHFGIEMGFWLCVVCLLIRSLPACSPFGECERVVATFCLHQWASAFI